MNEWRKMMFVLRPGAERQRFRSWLAEHDLVAFVALFILVSLLWAFAELSEEIREAETLGFDSRIMQLLRESGSRHEPRGPSWWTTLWLDITALGSAAVITVISSAVAGYLAIRGQKQLALTVVFAIVGSGVLSFLLKEVFDRPRPEVIEHYVAVSTASYPSGHSLGAAVAYPTLGGVAAQLSKGWRLKLYSVASALCIAFLVGFSRVYLGVHYPTDVLAGWCVGLGWAIICWLVLRRVEARSVT